MKKINLMLKVKTVAIIFIAALLSVSCSKDDSNEDVRITKGEQNQELYANDTESGVTFSTNGAWISSITGDATRGTTPDWVSITPDHGNSAGTYTIDISFTENNTGADRKATIIISCNGTNISIAINQKCTTKTGKDEIDPSMLPYVGEWTRGYSFGYERQTDGTYNTWADIYTFENKETLLLEETGVAKRKKANGTEVTGTWIADSWSMTLFFPGEKAVEQIISNDNDELQRGDLILDHYSRKKDYQYRKKDCYLKSGTYGKDNQEHFYGVWFPLVWTRHIDEIDYINDYFFTDYLVNFAINDDQDYRGYFVLNENTFTFVDSDFKERTGKWKLIDETFFAAFDDPIEPRIYKVNFSATYGDIMLNANERVNGNEYSYDLTEYIDLAQAPYDPRGLGTPYTIIGDWLLINQRTVKMQNGKIIDETSIDHPITIHSRRLSFYAYKEAWERTENGDLIWTDKRGWTPQTWTLVDITATTFTFLYTNVNSGITENYYETFQRKQY